MIPTLGKSRLIGYARVSTDDQATDAQTVGKSEFVRFDVLGSVSRVIMRLPERDYEPGPSIIGETAPLTTCGVTFRLLP